MGMLRKGAVKDRQAWEKWEREKVIHICLSLNNSKGNQVMISVSPKVATLSNKIL
jgi:hypothetical protein